MTCSFAWSGPGGGKVHEAVHRGTMRREKGLDLPADTRLLPNSDFGLLSPNIMSVLHGELRADR